MIHKIHHRICHQIYHQIYGITKFITKFVTKYPREHIWVTRKSVSKLISDPVALIRDIRTIVESHKNDSAEQSVTGKPLLVWPGLKNEKAWAKAKAKKKEKKEEEREEAKPTVRVVCKACPGCKLERCGRCQPCQALPRRRCVLRQCTQLVLAPPTVCSICGLDGWYAEPSMTLVDRYLGSNVGPTRRVTSNVSGLWRPTA